ncbi:hypothetical protein [Orenia marismortui]|uniref:Uncharacterized protein n=1 Tax=Orenia marismortui TaxID=46469 RepID=A0A4R8GG43_9FIRM|nr:hypothetical protein [Orenia marismortui]TDX44482.1 hypothetical protein C7959_15410 [Orenia marismortui]
MPSIIPTKGMSLLAAFIRGLALAGLVFYLFSEVDILYRILDSVFIGFIPSFHLGYVANRRGAVGVNRTRFNLKDSLATSIGFGRSIKWIIFVLTSRLLFMLLEITLKIHYIIMTILSIIALIYFIRVYYIEDRYKKED